MRYTILFLLFANIGYFIWTMIDFDQEVPLAPEPRELIKRGLMLVSEFEVQTATLALENGKDATLCSFVRGFSTVDDAGGFILDARRANLGALLNLTGDELASHFRVYLPPESNRILANQALERIGDALSETQLEVDTSLITRGPLTNGIGLGVFAFAADADLVRIQVSELGFSPEIEEIPRSNGEIQVVLRPLNSGLIETAEWLVLSDDRPDLTRTENLCETIAQASQFP